MLNVNNKKAINNISNKSLKANFTRNFLAIISIALTTIMFTTLFTISATIVNSFQQQNFRQVGGDFPLDFKEDLTGALVLSTYLKSVANIEKDAEEILSNIGYQCNDQSKDNYIDIGVNWSYLNAQISNVADGATIAGMVGVLIIIILTGYLIIYNIFQISVSSDIRLYGLLKTIGATGKQLKHISYETSIVSVRYRYSHRPCAGIFMR